VFNHSIDYRSVVVLGTPTLVEDVGEKRAALRAFTEQVAPGRWEEARQPTDKELKATWILSVPLDEASAKIRSGPPEDEPEDLELPVWAGVVPIHLAAEPSEYDWRRVRDGRVVAP
jgi:nitroimidazol reductase NimA-like FMN-containing flavoprotein (pyridoxamine 5'-phosphate oxidase superfamily)